MLYDRETARIWVGTAAGKVASVPLSAAADNPVKSALSRYAPYGWMETPRYTGGLMEVTKDLESIYIDGDFPTGTSVDLYWQDDASTGWEQLGSVTAGGTEVRWTSNRPNTKGLRLGLLLRTTDETATPLIRAVRVKYMAMVKDRYRWAFTVRVGDNLETVDGKIEYYNADAQRAALWTAAQSVPPVTFTDLDGTEYTVKVLDCIETAAKYQRDLVGTITFDGHMNLSLLQVT
jgi:hypothetical protein